MEKYDVCIMYQLYRIVTVEAENEDDAAEKALDSPQNDMSQAELDDEYVEWVHPVY